MKSIFQKEKGLVKKENNKTIAPWVITAVAALLIFGILFVRSRPGVADQGDFIRVMASAGLNYTEADFANWSEVYYTKVIEEYSIDSGWSFGSLLRPQTTMLFPVIAVRTVCKIFNVNFSTTYLAALLSFTLLLLTYYVFRAIYARLGGFAYVIALMTFLVLLSGPYLVWFNSLYQEGSVYLGYLLFLGSSLLAAFKKEKKGLRYLVPVFLSATFLLGLKPQLISALPIVLIVIACLVISKIPTEKKRRAFYFGSSFVLVCLMIAGCLYAYGVNRKGLGKATTYHSVFFGILNPAMSTDPQSDLIELGLDPSLAVDAGKTAYESEDSYFCPPGSQMAQDMIFSKVSTAKVALFYVKNPDKLLHMLNYTAENSYSTKSMFMKNMGEDADNAIVSYKWRLWDTLRMKIGPNTFLSYAVQYLLFFAVSLLIYIWRVKKGSVARWVIGLYWVNLLIGMLQYPLPFLGNGMADTTKQLFLFILSYDIAVLSSILFILYWLYRRFSGPLANLFNKSKDASESDFAALKERFETSENKGKTEEIRDKI